MLERHPPLSTWAHHEDMKHIPLALQHVKMHPPFSWAHLKGPKTQQITPLSLQSAKVHSLSPWANEGIVKGWRPNKSPLRPFVVWQCALEVYFLFLECMSTLQNIEWPLTLLLALNVHTPSLHAHFPMHASYHVLSFIDFHVQLYVMALCTWFSSISM